MQKNIWNQEFEDRINEINDKYLQIFNESFPNKEEVISASNNYQEAKQNASTGYNKHLYRFLLYFGLFLCALLIFIPFYWAFKKYKELKNQKELLEKKLEEATNNLSLVKIEACRDFFIHEYIKEVKSLLNYKDYGPITNGLLNAMNESTMIDFATSTPYTNPSDTTWGVLDDKIIINSHRYELQIKDELYTGTKLILLNNNKKSYSEIVTAYFYYPKPYFYDFYNQYIFTDFAEELNFKFVKKYTGLIKKNVRSDQIPMDNEEFDKLYDFNRTDENKFRMFFTPYAQEQFLFEDLEDNDKINKDLEPKLGFYKTGNFLGSTYKDCAISFEHFNINHVYDNFIYNPEVTIEQFINDILSTTKQNLFNFVHKLYANWFFPILKSVNQKNIINNALLNEDKYSEAVAYFILKRNFIFKFPTLDTPSIEYCKSNKTIYNGLSIYETNITSLTHKKEPRSTYVDKYVSGYGIVSINVDYFHYEPLMINTKMVYTIFENKNKIKFINDSYYDYYIKNNYSNKLGDLINKYQTEYQIEISINKSHICILDKYNNYSFEILKNILYNISSNI